MGRHSNLTAEDVPLVMALHEHGISKERIAMAFRTQPAMVGRVLDGWVPPPRAQLNEMERRRAIKLERGLRQIPSRPKPAYKRRALDAVHRAVKAGALTRGACYCGDPKTQAHHYRGYEPEHRLDVIWLCPKHHKELHKNHELDGRTTLTGVG